MNASVPEALALGRQFLLGKCFLVLIALTTIILASTFAQTSQSAPKPPSVVLDDFLKMETSGGRLTPEGWNKAASFFVRPIPMPNDISVIITVSAEAAIRYVREMEEKSNNLVIQQNALKTISILSIKRPPTFEQSAHVPDSPATNVVKQFCKGDAEGARLTPDGWQRVAQLFMQPPQRPSNQSIAVISRDYAVDQEDLKGNDIMIYVGYVDFGRLDSSLRLNPMPTPRGVPPNMIIKTARTYEVVLSDRYWIPTQDGKLKEITGLPEWKIHGYDSTQWITIETALQYVTKMRSRAVDPKIRKNADQTLVKLRRILHPRNSRPSACACF
jgi:hypothetical protein